MPGSNSPCGTVAKVEFLWVGRPQAHWLVSPCDLSRVPYSTGASSHPALCQSQVRPLIWRGPRGGKIETDTISASEEQFSESLVLRNADGLEGHRVCRASVGLCLNPASYLLSDLGQ